MTGQSEASVAAQLTAAERALAESERRFQRVFAESPVGMVVVGPDPELPIQLANPAFARLVGHDVEDLVGLPLHVVSHPDDLEREVALGLQMVAGEIPYYTIERRLVRRDGTEVLCRSTATIVTDDDGTVLYGIGMVQDVTDQVEARETIARQKEHLDLVLDAAGVCTWEVDLLTGRLELSENADEVFGLPGVPPPHDLDEFYRYVHPEDRYVFEEVIAGDREDPPAERFTIDFRVLPEDGVPRWMRLVGAWAQDGHQPGTVLRGTAADATERRQHERRIAELALIDELTDLPNRALLLDRLQVGIHHLGEGEVLGVLLCDLDRFKVVNESLGRRVGDELLVQVARRLRSWLGPEVTLARLGADEFVLVAEDAAGADLEALGERILLELDAPFELVGRSHHVSASIGLAVATTRADDADQLLSDAGSAASRAKDLGGGRIVRFDEALRTDAVARLELEDDLRRGLEADELVVHHQPVVTLDGEILGFEALVRWRHPRGGLIQPSRFVHVAEQTGLVRQIGRLVLERALRQLARWRRARPEAAAWTMAVNLSGRQLVEPGLVDEVHDALERHHVEPEALRLELTESVLMSERPEVDAAVAGLRDLGVRLAVDDFGTGYSSLVYLRRFPVDVLKLDRVFVQGSAQHAVDRAIISSMITLADTLGMQTVAEGVETRSQLEVLRALGCDAAQGFYWSPPRPAHEVEALLLDRSPGAPGRPDVAVVRGGLG